MHQNNHFEICRLVELPYVRHARAEGKMWKEIRREIYKANDWARKKDGTLDYCMDKWKESLEI